MTSEGRLCLGLADVKRYGVPYSMSPPGGWILYWQGGTIKQQGLKPRQIAPPRYMLVTVDCAYPL